MPTPHTPSLVVRRALRSLGDDIFDARKRRNLSATVVAQRAFTSRKSLMRVEKGDSSVSIGIYASVLNALGMIERLGELADASHDAVGLALMSEANKRKTTRKKS